MATKSQITLRKKEKEKQRARKKKLKMDKKELKKNTVKKEPEINWDIAPKNKTLTEKEKAFKESNKLNYLKL